MTQEEQEARRRAMEAEIAANEAADRESKRRTVRTLIIIFVVVFAGIGAYLAFRPHPEPEVYYKKDGNIDYVAQADKLRRSGKFKEVNAFRGGYAVVSDGKKYGIVDVKGNIICPIKYDEIESNYDMHYPDMALVRVGDKHGLVDKQGKEVLKPVYDDIGSLSSGTIQVTKGKESYYVDTDGNKVSE